MKEMEDTSQPFQTEELKQKHLKVLDVPQKKKNKKNQWAAHLLQNYDRSFILLTYPFKPSFLPILLIN